MPLHVSLFSAVIAYVVVVVEGLYDILIIAQQRLIAVHLQGFFNGGADSFRHRRSGGYSSTNSNTLLKLIKGALWSSVARQARSGAVRAM